MIKMPKPLRKCQRNKRIKHREVNIWARDSFVRCCLQFPGKTASNSVFFQYINKEKGATKSTRWGNELEFIDRGKKHTHLLTIFITSETISRWPRGDIAHDSLFLGHLAPSNLQIKEGNSALSNPPIPAPTGVPGRPTISINLPKCNTSPVGNRVLDKASFSALLKFSWALLTTHTLLIW